MKEYFHKKVYKTWSAPKMLEKNLIFGGAFLMSKYSMKFKLKIVKYCIENFNKDEVILEKYA